MQLVYGEVHEPVIKNCIDVNLTLFPTAVESKSIGQKCRELLRHPQRGRSPMSRPREQAIPTPMRIIKTSDH